MKFPEIKKIVRSGRMPRKPRYLKLINNGHSPQVYFRLAVFGSADTLKYLKYQKIKIEFEQRAYEIELYLNDKIDKIPMENVPTE